MSTTVRSPWAKLVSDLWDAMGPIIYGLIKNKFGRVQVLSRFGKSLTRRSNCQSEGHNKKEDF
jgi:hypothetical protein